jgi:predicted nucleic acid-binding protein
MSKIFLDTNILCYSMDHGSKSKMAASRAVLEKVQKSHLGVISTQVLQECYVTATRKLSMEPLQAKALAVSFGHFETVTITSALIKEAIDCQILNRLSFRDALIVVAAESARCDLLWTEDLNPGQIIRGVRIENPLSK